MYSRSKRYRDRKKLEKSKQKKLKVHSKKEPNVKKVERIRRKEFSKWTKKSDQNVIAPSQMKVINEYLLDLALLKGRGKVEKFKVKSQELLNQFTITQISKCTGIAPYKVHRKVNYKEKVRNEDKYVYKLTTNMKEQVAAFFRSSVVSYELPDMRFCEKKYMRMSLEEAYKLFKVNQEGERTIGRSTFCKLKPKEVKTIDQTPVRQCCCDNCENFRILILALIRCGIKGIPKNARKAIESTLCDFRKLPDIYTNAKYTAVPKITCCLGKCSKCSHKKEKMRIIRENTQLMASKKTVTWSRWIRPKEMNDENITLSKKNISSSEKKLKNLILVEKSGSPMDLLNEYINDLVTMRKHHFYNVWQQYQFMLCKANLQPKQLLIVQDFARNFVMDFQDEPQSLHWEHDQVQRNIIIIFI